MRLLVQLLFGGLLAFQAGAAGLRLAELVRGHAAIGWADRLTSSEDERIRRTLGDGFPVYRAIRDLVPANGVVVTRAVQGSMADFERLAAQNGAMQAIVNLCLPEPWVVRAADAIALLEERAPAGLPTFLLVMANDPAPAGRAGWTRVPNAGDFQLWRFQKGS